MYLRYHFLSCIILTLLLLPFFSYYSFLVFALGFFIDIDHYLYDLIRHKKFDLIEVYKRHMDKNQVIKDQLHIFHTIEFISLFILITLLSGNIYLLLLSTGFVLHLILDCIYNINSIRNNIIENQTSAFSLISWLHRN